MHTTIKGSQAIEAIAEMNIRPMAARYDVVEVNLHVDSPVLVVYTNELYNELVGLAEMRGGEFSVSEEDFTKYVNTIVKARVDYVRHERPLFGPTERVAIPSFLAVVLANLGIAVDVDKGIELRPSLEIDDSSLLSKDELFKISSVLKRFSSLGFEYSDGYARDRMGSWDFMAMSVIEDNVLRHDKESHPVYALMASTLAIRGIETVLSPRIEYGSVNHLASLVRQVATVRS